MQIENERRGASLVVRVSGRLDADTTPAFESHCQQAIAAGERALILDFGPLEYISSAGLRAFNNIFSRLRELSPDMSDEEMRNGINAGTYKSPHLKLANPSRATRLALETSGFSMFLEILPDVSSAISAF